MPRDRSPRPWPHGRKYISDDGRASTIRVAKTRTRHACTCGRVWDVFTDEGREVPDIASCPVCGQAVTTTQE